MTQPSVDSAATFRAVLNLEVKNGYANRAVIGGLDKYVARWVSQCLPGHDFFMSCPQLKTLLLGASYAEMSIHERNKWVGSVLQELKKPKTGPPATGSLDSPVADIRGVGQAIATRLTKLGIVSIRDLLYFFPRRFLDFSQRRTVSSLETGKEQTVFVDVWEARQVMLGRMKSTEAVLGDATGNVRAVWFNQPWLARQLKVNAKVALSGRVGEFNYVKVFENPEWEVVDDKELLHTGRLVPVYPLTGGLFPKSVRAIVRNALDGYLCSLPEFLPPPVRQRCGLMDLKDAVMQAHYPLDHASQNKARQRLAFDELFLLQLGVLSRKRDWQEQQPGRGFQIERKDINGFIGALPFKLTSAQDRVIDEICRDLGRDLPMSRLLQGDVGSGKTVVATVALLAAVTNGCQGALMAPTEILAEQHFSTLHRLLSAISDESSRESNIYTFKDIMRRDIRVALLTGSLAAREKSRTHGLIKSGEVDIVVGTHALVQKGVNFAGLGLAVIDEQHRFGVLQRSALKQKGYNPHLLVMTATPIPRTLALTLFGDLDISTIDEMPAGRQAIKTRWLKLEDRRRAYNFIRKQAREGRQSFIICPLIEESESLEVKAAVAEHKRLSGEVFPDLKLGLLHGRMKSADKEAVMHAFKDGALDILVSTSVVEVGIDVPNATVMLVEAADRFGLSQLHQFRGRVGRGESQSYCMLMSENPSEYGQERLRAIEELTDGFALAEKDLELRGPGEFFGTRQSGLPDLKMARLSDTKLLEMARREAVILFEKDPGLIAVENELLAREYNRIWHKSVENN
ncbi:MAG: ATP-dependent DNA helicase RecG [Chloroflexi bacterium]|nr:ATP-dependent DNA helicase RecG [Chloroflexota bacterium]